MSELSLNTLEELDEVLKQDKGVLLYFSTPQCNVCKVLRPKLMQLFEEHYPEIKRYYIDTTTAVELSAQHSVFTVPTILLFLDGKEFVRKSRNFSPAELISEIRRPWEIMHS
ncbi:MAG: thioredoxin family protein [Thiotrichales bacterium]|jgi:thioredoxin-like negative regulator of GroEL|nr:thioredoxin family protein [Thiotrichales bacterium]MBT3613767.1 thioredoxin family protein [Thiotrichales bacterium]MBT3753207.1 thioredoxin family protein [Thiotrichales bacterium]MBT3837888.1 thioredoxin family protein [Thiotrichales bacterium]MBT4152059.1 thioredoxin family protein [Thiotrichales bacterium]